MSRTVGLPTTFTCLTCRTTRHGTWWAGNADSQAMKWNYDELSKGCGNEKCTNPQLRRNSRSGSSVLRNSRPVAIYLFPDGDYAATPDSDPHSEFARTNSDAGGVRMELTSVRELREFQRQRGQQKMDEWRRRADEGGFYDPMFGIDTTPDEQTLRDRAYESGRNQVIDYDDKSLRDGHDRIREHLAAQREQNERAVSKFRSLRVGRAGDNERYERLKRGGR